MFIATATMSAGTASVVQEETVIGPSRPRTRNPSTQRFRSGVRHHKSGSEGVGTSAPQPAKKLTRQQQGAIGEEEAAAAASELAHRPRLLCPGGPRLSAFDLKRLYLVPSGTVLANLDHRFVLNLRLTHSIAHLFNKSDAAGKLFIELGPGAGALTRTLLAMPGTRGVLGIEMDSRYNAHLESIREECSQQQNLNVASSEDAGTTTGLSSATTPRFYWCNADVLNVDEVDLVKKVCPEFYRHCERAIQKQDQLNNADLQWQAKAKRETREKRREKLRMGQPPTGTVDDDGAQTTNGGGASAAWRLDPPLEVIGNLPFAIAPALSVRYAIDCSRRRNLFQFGRIPTHLFFQKEVAERAIATPGTREYGRLTVILQNYFAVTVSKTFQEMTYFPRTEVLGALVTLIPRVTPLVDVDGNVLASFVDLLLKPSQRRRTTLMALERTMPMEVAHYVLREARVDGAMSPLELQAGDIAGMASLWVKYLQATQQHGNASASTGTQERDFSAEHRAKSSTR